MTSPKDLRQIKADLFTKIRELVAEADAELAQYLQSKKK
jgi:hypothetical protein